MLPGTKKLLEADIEKRRNELASISEQGGRALGRRSIAQFSTQRPTSKKRGGNKISANDRSEERENRDTS